jgi:hypothetical protein
VQVFKGFLYRENKFVAVKKINIFDKVCTATWQPFSSWAKKPHSQTHERIHESGLGGIYMYCPSLQPTRRTQGTRC